MSVGSLLGSLVAGTAAVSTGCCISSFQQEQAMQRELESRNRAQAEPAMRAAAQAQGAALLPQRVESVHLPPCDPGQLLAVVRPDVDLKKGCLDWSAKERVYRLRTQGASPRLVIPYTGAMRPYVRVARRGNKILLLEPIATLRKARDAHRCWCFADMEGGPGAYGDPLLWLNGFFVDDADEAEVEEVRVPVIVDFIEWHCG